MEIISRYQTELLLGLALLVVIEFFLLLAMNSRLNRISRLLRTLFTGPQGEDLESLLKRCLNESARSMERSDELGSKLVAVADKVRHCIQHVGIIRYDAYDDVSGEQSFSLALLDAQQNGAIITGLFGRRDSRCYGKPVADGRAEQTLTEEESSALAIALKNSGSQA